MLTDIGVPILRRLHKASFQALQVVGQFEDYLYRWRIVLGDLAEDACPCGCLNAA